MVNKISGRRIDAHHIEYRKIADSAQMGFVSRGQLIGLAKNMKKTKLLKETEVELLLELLNTAPKASFEKGGVPLVFKSNRKLSSDINRSQSRVSYLLSRLYDNGLIVMRDSSNFKRYSVHSKDNEIACGIDLRILVARYDELKQKVDVVLKEKEKQEDALHYFRGLVRQIKDSYKEMKTTTSFTALLFARMQKIMDIIGRPAKASFEKLQKASHLLEWILQRGFKEKIEKTRYRHLADKIHIEHTTHNYKSNCNKKECSEKSEHTQINNMTFGHDKKAYENKQKGKTEGDLPSKESELLQIKPKFLAQALPNTARFLKHGLQSERDLIGSMELLAKMKGISPHALQEAKQTMGIKKTALAIALIVEKHCKEIIKSPGGYLRGMIAKENKGELYLERSFYALLDEEFKGKLHDFPIAENNKINSNDEKIPLFKSELNKVLKKLEMPKNHNKFA
ncbi:plasmid replication protein RepC [Bartonella harrusi]|uniref:Replication initiation protein RepC n=1 Tax=Bartonella harrusi TaxID=2961895 RepID=A0ABY5ES38_9HYPH|nr:plasmid replication protein RepC [Bartonella harrusi]UTO27681.1 replication initiation protein RepC [Bartonella harrusi]